MSSMWIQGVVFDVDGLLFDTERLGRHAWETVGAQMGYPHVALRYLDYVGKTKGTILQELLQLHGDAFPAEAFLQACSLCTQEEIIRTGVPLRPGVREILAFLHQHRLPMAIATSTYRSRTLQRLELAGLSHYFQSITTGDEVAVGKPDPAIYTLAAQRLGTPPAHTLAVEDSRNGILSAAGAGLRPVMIPDLIPPTPALDQLLFRRFDSLLELRDFFAQQLSA